MASYAHIDVTTAVINATAVPGTDHDIDFTFPIPSFDLPTRSYPATVTFEPFQLTGANAAWTVGGLSVEGTVEFFSGSSYVRVNLPGGYSTVMREFYSEDGFTLRVNGRTFRVNIPNAAILRTALLRCLPFPEM